jgi:hypothetical protein
MAHEESCGHGRALSARLSAVAAADGRSRELPVPGVSKLHGLDPEAKYVVTREIIRDAIDRGLLRAGHRAIR